MEYLELVPSVNLKANPCISIHEAEHACVWGGCMFVEDVISSVDQVDPLQQLNFLQFHDSISNADRVELI